MKNHNYIPGDNSGDYKAFPRFIEIKFEKHKSKFWKRLSFKLAINYVTKLFNFN